MIGDLLTASDGFTVRICFLSRSIVIQMTPSWAQLTRKIAFCSLFRPSAPTFSFRRLKSRFHMNGPQPIALRRLRTCAYGLYQGRTEIPKRVTMSITSCDG